MILIRIYDLPKLQRYLINCEIFAGLMIGSRINLALVAIRLYCEKKKVRLSCGATHCRIVVYTNYCFVSLSHSYLYMDRLS